jgi:hypothetical protein
LDQVSGLIQRSAPQVEPLDQSIQGGSGIIPDGRPIHRIPPRCIVRGLSFRSRRLSLSDESNGALQAEAVVWPSQFLQPFQMRAQSFKIASHQSPFSADGW